METDGQRKMNNSVENKNVGYVFRSYKIRTTYLMAKRNQNQRKTMSGDFDFINKSMCCRRDVLQAFKAKGSTELFVSNWEEEGGVGWVGVVRVVGVGF